MPTDTETEVKTDRVEALKTKLNVLKGEAARLNLPINVDIPVSDDPGVLDAALQVAAQNFAEANNVRIATEAAEADAAKARDASTEGTAQAVPVVANLNDLKTAVQDLANKETGAVTLHRNMKFEEGYDTIVHAELFRMQRDALTEGNKLGVAVRITDKNGVDTLSKERGTQEEALKMLEEHRSAALSAASEARFSSATRAEDVLNELSELFGDTHSVSMEAAVEGGKSSWRIHATERARGRAQGAEMPARSAPRTDGSRGDIQRTETPREAPVPVQSAAPEGRALPPVAEPKAIEAGPASPAPQPAGQSPTSQTPASAPTTPTPTAQGAALREAPALGQPKVPEPKATGTGPASPASQQAGKSATTQTSASAATASKPATQQKQSAAPQSAAPASKGWWASASNFFGGNGEQQSAKPEPKTDAQRYQEKREADQAARVQARGNWAEAEGARKGAEAAAQPKGEKIDVPVGGPNHAHARSSGGVQQH